MIFVIVAVFTFLIQGKMMSPDTSYPVEPDNRETTSDVEEIGEELVDWGSVEERFGDRKKPKKRKQRVYEKYKSRDGKRFQSYRDQDTEDKEEDDAVIIDELLGEFEGDMNRAMEELQRRKQLKKEKDKNTQVSSEVKDFPRSKAKKPANKYARLLQKKQSVRDAFVLSEILHKKYN